jgi:hypothetical protein
LPNRVSRGGAGAVHEEVHCGKRTDWADGSLIRSVVPGRRGTRLRGVPLPVVSAS